MLYRCIGCGQGFHFPVLKKGVHALCPQCGADLEEAAEDRQLYGSLVRRETGKAEEMQFPVSPGLLIGRDGQCGIRLDEDSVSGVHAMLTCQRDGRICVVDRDSRNGVRVNGIRVSAKTLRDGDELKLGRVGLVYRTSDPRSAATSPAADLTVSHGDDREPAFETEYKPGSTLLIGPAGSAAPGGTADDERRRMGRALEMTAELATKIQRDALLDTLASFLFEMFQVERVVVVLKEPERQGFAVALARDAKGAQIQSFTLSRTLVRKVIAERTAVVISNVLTDDRIAVTGSIMASGMRSALLAPLLGRDEVLGVVWADTLSEAKKYGDADLKIFCGLAGVAAVSLANARLYERAIQESRVRTHLSRYLAPSLVQQVVEGKIPMQMGGDERDVTVLFSDLRGFTAASEKMEPPALVKMLNRYFGRMVDVVFRHGGTVDKFIGDAIMAVWGVPQTQGNHALAAVRAAIDMQRALVEFNAESHALGIPPIAMGIGIHSGSVVAANIGSPLRMEFTVIGDTVNTASRIESSTGAGDVFIGRTTFDSLEGLIPATPLPPIRVKNKAQPLELFALDLAGLTRAPAG